MVVPVWLRGEGWETSMLEAMLMVMLPCETAQFEILILEVATIVPVRSLMTMRAGVAGGTSQLRALFGWSSTYKGGG